MKYSDFEKHIGKKLADAEAPVNMELLLDQLGLVEPSKEKKVRPFPFWILIPIVVLGSIFTFMTLKGNKDAVDENPLKYLSNAEIIQQLKKNKNPIAKIITTQTEALDETTIDQTVGISAVKQSSENQLTNDSEADGTKIQLDRKSYDSRSINDRSTIQTENVSSQNRGETFSKKASERRSPQYTSSQSNAQNTKAYVNKKIDAQISNIQNAQFEEGNTKNNAAADQSEAINRSTVNLPPSLSRDMIKLKGLEEDDNGLFTRMKINCPSFNQAYWRLALIPEVGVFTPFKTLENKLQEDTPDFIARQSQETTLEGLNIGLYTMLVRDKLPVYVKAGISYSRITERMNLEYNYTTQDTSIGVISETVSANGDTITQIYGDVITEIRKTGKNRQHSYIHLFDVPISVGYNTYLGGFDIGVEGGVRVNLMTRATGALLVSESEFTNLSLDQKFKPRIGLSYFGGLLIGRNFGRFGDFYLAPRFTYFPDDFSNAQNNIRQKYMSVGVNVGVVFNIQ